MWERIKGFFRWVRAMFEKRRFRKLTQNLPYRPVVLKNEGENVTRRQFLAYMVKVALPLLAMMPISRVAKAALAKKLAEKSVPASFDSTATDSVGEKQEYMIAGHTDISHTNAHTNNPSKHVDVPSEVGHYDKTHPHMNTHFNNPHVDETTPDEPEEEPGTEEEA